VIITNQKFLYKILTSSFCVCILFNLNSVLASKKILISVLIAQDKNLRVRSDNNNHFVVKNKDFEFKNINGVTLKMHNNKIIFYFDKNKKKHYVLNKKESLNIKSFDRRGIWVGSKRYSGLIKITSGDNNMNVVNVLGVEKYLYSVVGSEMPHTWPIEALKAQAIASRTYALKKIGSSTLYDIDSTKYDQVYNGLESSTFKTYKAVRKTKNLVITYNNKLINALFHSSSGGLTENSQDVWTNKYPYLKSVKDFDQNNPKIKWKKKFTGTNLEELFPITGGISDIKILKISDTGRIKSLKISGKYGSKIISGIDFRKRLSLKSTLFRFKFLKKYNNQKISGVENSGINNEDLIIFTGLGSGHGVGMSQWGAKYMAQKGFNSFEILKHFYKGVKINTFKSIYK